MAGLTPTGAGAAVLTVNAGSSTLKFSLYPLHAGEVQAVTLGGSIEGLEPGGRPMMGWTLHGQRQRRELAAGPGGAFGVALQAWDPLESTCRHASLSIL